MKLCYIYRCITRGVMRPKTLLPGSEILPSCGPWSSSTSASDRPPGLAARWSFRPPSLVHLEGGLPEVGLQIIRLFDMHIPFPFVSTHIYIYIYMYISILCKKDSFLFPYHRTCGSRGIQDCIQDCIQASFINLSQLSNTCHGDNQA